VLHRSENAFSSLAVSRIIAARPIMRILIVLMSFGLLGGVWDSVLAASGSDATPNSTAADGVLSDKLRAHWIWRAPAEPTAYNQILMARKRFRLSDPSQGWLRITADSYYRLYINDQWVNDGPSRSWPEHFQYDELDVSSYLRSGENEIRVIARYYGVGDFHRVPRHPGMLAQLDVRLKNGRRETIITDRTWEVAMADAWTTNTPKVSIQMEPAEWYDARLENGLRYVRARELFAAEAGPWKNLNPRDVALMTRQPFALKSFLGAKIVQAEGLNFCLPAARLANPGLIEANHTVSCACGMATVLENNQPCELRMQTEGMRFTVDGHEAKDGRFSLKPGQHLVLAFVAEVCGHEKEKSLRFMKPSGFRLTNPLANDQDNPWCFLRFPEFVFATNDLRWIGFRDEDARITDKIRAYGKEVDNLLQKVRTIADFRQHLAHRAESMASQAMFVQDSAWQFYQRQEVGDGTAYVQNPAALMHNTPQMTVVKPCAEGDVELLYDLGEQNCGYFDFEMLSDAGVVVDLYAVEYIAPDGRIQHSWGNRNGLRYITRSGINRFLSLKRRSGRFWFLTLRNVRSPVSIRNLQLIESTYPVNAIGQFACSDTRLDKIWEISARTLKLCMEDTFTDCPLYEQTHWVGDARNESLFAYGVFGATDLGRHCIRITAQSLERYPFAGCQTPSCWDCLLPAWSFLWGISTWDYFWHTGDQAFLREMYPFVIRNLKGAEQYVTKDGLFSGPFWNMFDWTPIDQGQKTVLHNTMFMIGAVRAARESAGVIGESQHNAWLDQLGERLVQGVNRLWDPVRGVYPDSIRDDGSVSPSTSQHTSFLAVLYDIVRPDQLEATRRNLLEPPEKMVRIGSPFAVLYLYETLEKLGLHQETVKQIYQNYLPMLEAGATTVWESFPSGTTGSGGFPTRSHCHAWSSAPVLFLNRIILGVYPVAPASAEVVISPRLSGLTWARGTTATVNGPIRVSWSMLEQTVNIQCQAPSSVRFRFESNDSLKDKTVVFNGQTVLSRASGR
jgi:hypothetical protein